jgi:predicted DNA-binding protein
MNEKDKFIIRAKKNYGEHAVVSCRMPVELIRKPDDAANRTGRTRNELIMKCVEFALDKLEIVDEP